MTETSGPTIIKVQLSGATNRSDAGRLDAVALVHDKKRKYERKQPISQKVRDAMKGDVRAFFEGRLHGERWEIGKRVPEQFW